MGDLVSKAAPIAAIAAAPFTGGTSLATLAGTSGSILSSLATAAQIGGTILSGVGALQSFMGGNAQAEAIQKSAVYAASEERSRAAKAAEEQRRQASTAKSRATAVAAASGGGVLDPTVVDITSELAGEGEYRALTELYEGESRARGIIGQASADAYSAKQKGMAGLISGGMNMLSSGSSLFEKFGQGGPVKPLDTVPDGRIVGKSYQTPFGNRTFYS